MLLPFQRGGRIFGALPPRRLVDDLQRQLAMAGSPLGLGPREFYGLRMISILVGLGVAFLLLRGLAPQSRPTTPSQPGAVTRQATAQVTTSQRFTSMAGSLVAVYVGFYFPKRWVRGRLRRG